MRNISEHVRAAILFGLLVPILLSAVLYSGVRGDERRQRAAQPVRVVREDLPPPVPRSRVQPPDIPAHHGHGNEQLPPSRFRTAFPIPADAVDANLMRQTEAAAAAKSRGCVVCHENVGDMHQTGTVNLGCVDCHGGDPNTVEKHKAHVHPRLSGVWQSAANPVRSYTALNHEYPEFIRFVNPGDLRVANLSCGKCHPNEVLQVRKSMMTHGCMLWGAALYNNGSIPNKIPRFGESYSMHGRPQRMQTVPQPHPWEVERKGVLPFLDPLPRFEVSIPGNILRIFERGGRFRPEIGLPERLEEPGRPRERLSIRGLGTENRTDPVTVGLTKTRLLDPTLNFLGTNDHPGDFRSSGCTACHVVYANDRSPVHSGQYAKFGNMGRVNPNGHDPMISPDESGHPIEHKFTLSIPSSQCIVCHVHPGTNVLNTYLGYMWWDNETDGELMYPPHQKHLSDEQLALARMSNPEEAAARGYWSDAEFLANVTDLNPHLRHTQFADFHGHGWVFRGVFKKDREGLLLDHRGQRVEKSSAGLQEAVRPPDDREKVTGKKRDDVPVHLMDIHLEKGMHCVDCHFSQDVHGDTRLYGEVRAAIEIGCEDCHGTARKRVTDTIRQFGLMPTTGPAAPPSGTNLLAKRTPFGRPRFELKDGTLYQNSMVERGRRWEVVQTADTITPGHPRYNVKSHISKTIEKLPDDNEELIWGRDPNSGRCAHDNKRMTCVACHSSWNTSCFGCHLPQKANKKSPALHNGGDVSRNYTSYNFQTLRDDVYMLGIDGNVTGNRIAPVRSACAIHVTSYNQNRESIYVQQQTISGSGQSGIAFSPNIPHTVRGGPGIKYGNTRSGTHETKMCTDCHLSRDNDNNAIMAQLLMQGTNYVNFIGRYCWVAAGEHGFEGVVVTERDEPQAVIGSSLHRLAYPDHFRKHMEHDGFLEHAHEHPGKDILHSMTQPWRKPKILNLQARGEYLYAACGKGGLRVFDIAFIDDKAFSERITTAPVSPLGQKFYVPSAYATDVAAPTTIAPDPTRIQFPANDEQPVHGIYAYIYFTDAREGLIMVGAGTLLDGNPLNNFLKRETTFNEGGVLNGARSISIVGTYAYICADAGLVVVSIEDPKKPAVVAVLGPDVLKRPRAVAVQFRYAFVCDDDGMKVLNIDKLHRPRLVAELPLTDARKVYVARTYAYVAGGAQGLVIVDVKNPERPQVDQVYDADGCINDLNDVKLGITNVSEFAYLADGHNGLRVVQLTSPETPGNDGFSPRPTPRLVATYKLPKGGHALAVSKGVDRDRAVDESGNQIAVFGRVGARPMSADQQARMYKHPRTGRVFKVSDDPFDQGTYSFPAWLRTRFDPRR